PGADRADAAQPGPCRGGAGRGAGLAGLRLPALGAGAVRGRAAGHADRRRGRGADGTQKRSPPVTGYSNATIWLIILVLALGTYGLRWSFLGVLGGRPMPLWAQRLLRYTAVGVLPAIVAPLVVW